MRKRLPIGISDFKRIVEDDYYYIDKTLIIQDLIESGGLVTILPRPRRFGKTLNLSMLRYFFENSKEETAHLFYDKKIWQVNELKDLQGQFPVIYLSFKDVKEQNWESAYASLIRTVSTEFRRHASDLLPTLTSVERKDYDAIMDRSASQADYKNSLLFLSQLLSKHYQKRVVFLLDEYDTPIHTSFQHSYYNPLIEFLRAILGSVLKDNIYLERGVVTGITRIAKEGIFSDLNNLVVLSLLQSPASDKFGFVEEETSKLLFDYGFKDSANTIKAWYNGYRIGNMPGVYNPWSILNCLNFNGEVRAYWGKTSANDTIKKVIREGNADFKKELFSLLQGESLNQIIDEGLIYPGIEQNPAAIWNLLFFTGYLTFTESKLIDSYDHCQLKIPNLEMHQVFDQLIASIMEEALGSSDIKTMLSAMLSGDSETFGAYFQKFIINSLSYHDLSHPLPENSYHMFVLGLLMFLNTDYEIKSNRESGLGRYDIMIIPRSKEKLGVIIEFKNCDPKETLAQGAERAIEQIKNKNYAQEQRSRNITRLIGYGIAFQGKDVFLLDTPL